MSPERSPWPVPLPSHSYSWQWLAHPLIVHQARSVTRGTLINWSAGNYTIDDAVTIASEIVANAVKASTKDQAVTLALFVDARNVLVMWFDEADGMPVVQSPTVDQTSGRGLVLVEALRESFWTFDLDDMGKVVFVRIARL